MVTVAEAVGEALAGLGVRRVFGLVGSGNFHVANALVAHGASFVAARHEGASVSMADGYARVMGEVGVCTVHQGPGLTNTLTALTEAAKSRTPLLLLAADTAASALRSNFRIEQDALVRSVGAVAERLHGPDTAVADAARAYRRALLERCAVVLMMPLDVQAAACTHLEVPAAPPSVRPTRPSDTAIAEAVAVLSRAQRPLIIAGRGAVVAGAGPALAHLADLVGALLATTANGNGLFTGNEWSIGISGGFASPGAAELIAEADVILGVGAALNMWTTRHGHLVGPHATVIQVDHDADAIGAHHRADLALVGDAAETARVLAAAFEGAPRGPAWRTPVVARRIHVGAWATTEYADASTDTHIDPRTLSLVLNEVVPNERIVAIDSGHFMGYPAMYLDVPDAQGFVFTQAFQAVGLGLASAIGAAVAQPDRLTVAALGDGGAMLALQELDTVARLDLCMLIVVYNDSAYGAEVHHFGPHGSIVDLVRFDDVDFAAYGRAAGLEGITVRQSGDLAAVRDWVARGMPRALVVDARVVPTVVAEWLDEAFRGH